MKNRTAIRWMIFVFAASMVTSETTAQWQARFGLPPNNPNSGLEMNPSVIYDYATGVVSLDNVGNNGIVDSSDNSTLLGDDVGMISFVLSSRRLDFEEITPLLPTFEEGIAWNWPIYFNGAIQFMGTSITGQFLPISESPTELFQLPAGLSAADFVSDSGVIEIELGTNHTVAGTGVTLFSVGDPIASGAFEILTPDGDFDADAVWNCADIDALVAEIASGTDSLAFDLTGDQLVDEADLDAWLALAGERNLASGNPYIFGDANLDGNVDVSDLNVWNSNKFTTTSAWCSGDFNVDGFVDVSDFNVWNSHKFLSANQLVPEPSTEWLMLMAIVLLVNQRISRNPN